MPPSPMDAASARVVDPILSTIIQGYRHPERIGHTLFPAVPVNQRGGRYITFGKESFKLHDIRRAPGAATKSVEHGYGSNPYGLVQDAIEGKVPREIQEEAAAVPGIDMGKLAVQEVGDIITLRLEYDQATLARDPANYDSDHKIDLAAAKWTGANDPVADINAGRTAIRESVGIYPNTLVLSAAAFEAACNNAKVLERFKYTTNAVVTEPMLAAIFKVDRVVVGKAIAFDDAGATIDIWGTDAVLAYVPTTIGSIQQPSFGYTYTLRNHPLVERPYWNNNTKSWHYPVTYERQPLMTGMLSGYLLRNLA
jgi:hypothetical protein